MVDAFVLACMHSMLATLQPCICVPFGSVGVSDAASD